MTAPAAARTGRYGVRRYPIPRGEGDSLELLDLPSVSNILKVLDAPGLNQWKLNTLAEVFAHRPDLIMLAGSPDTRRSAISQALDADKSKANIGTAVHFYTEAVDAGTLDWDLVPNVARPWVEQYAMAKEKHGWRMVEKEVTVWNFEHGYAGTTDLFMEFRDEGVCCADKKTGKGVYADQALQLSMYANGEGIWTPPDSALVEAALADILAELAEDERLGLKRAEDGKKISAAYVKRRRDAIDEQRWLHYGRLGNRRPMPEGLRTDVGFIIHLSDTACDLYPMNLEGAYKVVGGICAAYHWKERKDVVGRPVGAVEATPAARVESDTPPVDPLTPTGSAPVSTPPSPEVHFASLRERLIALPQSGKDAVAFEWPQGTPGLKVLAHSELQLDLIDRLLFDAETKALKAAEQDQAVAMVEKVFADDCPF